MSTPLQEYDGVLHSRMGAFFPGSHVIFRGRDLHAELKDMDWLELYVYGITGRRHTPEQLRLLHAIWTHTSYPDVRLWNNRVAALTGSARSTGVLGLSAALAVSEAAIYGGQCFAQCMDFLRRTRKRLDQGCELSVCIDEELNGRRIIKGYGRPIIDEDERNPYIFGLAHELGLDRGPHRQLALVIEEYLTALRPKLRMNYVGATAGLLADMGFSAREYYLFMFPVFLAGMPPCYIEATEQPEGSLYAMACGTVAYEGECPRSWPGKTSP